MYYFMFPVIITRTTSAAYCKVLKSLHISMGLLLPKNELKKSSLFDSTFSKTKTKKNPRTYVSYGKNVFSIKVNNPKSNTSSQRSNLHTPSYITTQISSWPSASPRQNLWLMIAFCYLFFLFDLFR